MTESKPESATLKKSNFPLTRRLINSALRLCRALGLTFDFTKTFFAFAFVDAFSGGISAVLAPQWKRYPVIA
ncbi:MAG TPA: hypothetical protein DEF79_11920 [Gammaproteobacteria bacterium]|nr:hypothetical protein [Gammaproteobacteria bacterium]|tara:strand:- start:1 stop:216 length:216 start_codon:yes stop_codon:yes gene_type:complete